MAVFLTGGTGFLGRLLLRRLLEDGEAVVLLVRGGEQAEAAARVSHALRGAGADPTSLEGSVHVCRGALDAPGLGLSAEDREYVLSACDRFLHCGASVRFDLTLEKARAVNLEGTRAVLGLARERHRRRGLTRFDHVGTAYVAGLRTGLVREEELDGSRGHRNTYERSKFEAEQLVREAMSDIPACVFRPSIVVGDSADGRTSAFHAMYWPLRIYASGLWRTCPGRPGAPIDLVPVDFVRDAVTALSRRPETVGHTFHLAAGAEGSMTLGAMAAAAATAFRKRKPVRFVDPGPWMRWVHPVLKHLALGSVRRTVRNGEFFVPYFVDNPLFDNSGARAALADSGMAIPRVADYLERVFAYCRESDWGRRPVSVSRPAGSGVPTAELGG
jgi:long-chain acyl-CoA synthetase